MLRHLFLLLLPIALVSTSYAEELISPEGEKTIKHHAGLRLTAQRSPYIGSSTELYALPLLQYNYGPFFAGDRVGLGSFFGYVGGWILALSGSLGFGDVSRNDIDELAALPDLRDGIALNFLTAKSFGRGDVAISVSKELGDASDGWDADIFYFYTIDHGRWSFQPSMVLNWQNADAVDYAYGVDEGVAGFAAYEGRSTLNYFPEMIVTYQLFDQWRLHTSLAWLRYGSNITRSPIVDKKSRIGVYVGLAWHWEEPFPF